MRCWRDLDSAEISEDAELHVQVLDQLERALDFGYAQILISQLTQLGANEESNRSSLITLSILGPQLTRAALLKDPTLNQEAWQNAWNTLPMAWKPISAKI